MNMQSAIDDYLIETAREILVADEFRDWLAERPDHPLYERFLGEAQEDAARKWQIHKIRMAISGLRIMVRHEEIKRHKVTGITVKEYPAFYSPMGGRQGRGGYYRTNPSDEVSIASLRTEGIVGLHGWLNRYGAVFGADAKAIYDLVDLLSTEAIQDAA